MVRGETDREALFVITVCEIFSFFQFLFVFFTTHFFLSLSLSLFSVVKSKSSSFLVSLIRRGKKHNREEGEKEEDKEEEEEEER